LELIQDLQADEWWENVSYPMLEEVRRKLRGLVHLIERSKKGVIYSDFVDELGVSVEIDLPGTGGAVAGNEFVQFRKKAEHFLKENLGEGVVAKVRSGQPLSDADIAELQRILVAAGIGGDETFEEASERLAASAGSSAQSSASTGPPPRAFRPLPRRQALLQEPDRVRQPHHQRARRAGDRRSQADLRSALYRLGTRGPRQPLRRTRRSSDP
jgi:type I site-specific restriction endonuclease